MVPFAKELFLTRQHLRLRDPKREVDLIELSTKGGDNKAASRERAGLTYDLPLSSLPMWRRSNYRRAPLLFLTLVGRIWQGKEIWTR